MFENNLVLFLMKYFHPFGFFFLTRLDLLLLLLLDKNKNNNTRDHKCIKTIHVNEDEASFASPYIIISIKEMDECNLMYENMQSDSDNNRQLKSMMNVVSSIYCWFFKSFKMSSYSFGLKVKFF